MVIKNKESLLYAIRDYIRYNNGFDNPQECIVENGNPKDGYVPFHDGLIELTADWYYSWCPLRIHCGDGFEEANKVLKQIQDSTKDIPLEFYDEYAKYHILWTAPYFNEHWEECLETINKTPISELCQEYIDNYSDESPAYIKIQVIFNDEKQEVITRSCINNDFGYGRERVGAWANKLSNCSYIGDHYVDAIKVKYSPNLFNEIKIAFDKINKTINQWG